MIFFGEAALGRATKEYVAHYHSQRNHQGLDNKLIEPSDDVGTTLGDVISRERVGGLLKYYDRDPGHLGKAG